MAKKKNSKKTTPKVVEPQKKETMKSKVEIKQPPKDKQERMSRIVGSIFIGLGVLLVAFGIYSIIRFREEPILNIDLEPPVLSEVTALTSGQTIIIRGTAQGFDEVFIYINDEKAGRAKIQNDYTFSYEYTVENEGEFQINIAGVKGFPNRVISSRTEAKTSLVDWTNPSTESVSLIFGEETNKETFILAGTAEPLSTVTVRRGTVINDVIANEQGEFRIENIPLEEGKNVFTVSIKDRAGNEVILEEKIRVTFSPEGEINGDAVVDENIPQASGELDILFGNQLMFVFAIVALVIFSTRLVYLYKRNR